MSHQLVNQTNGDFERYTPPEIIEAVREVMGDIDLDVASSVFANEFVGAANYYTIEDDGLSHVWYGRVWMNHPFHRGERACVSDCKKKACVKRGHHLDKDIPGNRQWIDKLVHEFKTGQVEQACCITYAATSEKWFFPLHQFPQCYIGPGRVNYLLPDGTVQKGNTKGSVVTYFGQSAVDFYSVFKEFGSVKLPYEKVIMYYNF